MSPIRGVAGQPRAERLRLERPAVEPLPRVGGRRRRGAGLEEAIHRAVLELLAAIGYEALTMEKVALRARTGKAALYRRWTTKSELVLDALVPFVELDDPLPDTGSLREDVVVLLAEVAESMDEPIARGAATALAEFPATPNRRSGLRARFLGRRREAIEAVLARAVARGEVPGPARAAVAESALAMLVYRMLTDGLPITRAAVEQIVDDVVLPLARAGGDRGEPGRTAGGDRGEPGRTAAAPLPS